MAPVVTRCRYGNYRHVYIPVYTCVYTQLTEQSGMFRCASTSIDDRPKHCGSNHPVARDRACLPARAWPH